MQVLLCVVLTCEQLITPACDQLNRLPVVNLRSNLSFARSLNGKLFLKVGTGKINFLFKIEF